MPTIQQVGKPRVRLRALPAVLPLNIELQATDEAIQWRYVGAADDTWLDLVLIDDIDVEVTVGAVTTLAAGEPASVFNSGTSRDIVLDFGIPAGSDSTMSSVVAGSGIDVDATDPGNPVVSVEAPLADLASRFTPASSSGPSSLDLLEDADNGTSRVRLTAAASLTADRTVTFPDADGTAMLTSAIGTDVQAWDADLDAVAALAATGGILTKTGAGAFAVHTIAGTANQIAVTNGDGISGAPTLSLPADVIIPAVLTVPNTGLHILDNNASHDVVVSIASNITADRNLTIQVSDANTNLNLVDPGADRLMFWDDSAAEWTALALTSNLVINGTTLRAYEVWGGAISDETTAITTGTGKLSFSIPYAFTVVGVYATLNTVSSSGTPTFDINEAGTTILSTKIVIDVSEFTGGSAGYQGTAAGAAVISDTSIAAFAQITVDIDVAGTGAKGAKVFIVGYPT